MMKSITLFQIFIYLFIFANFLIFYMKKESFCLINWTFKFNTYNTTFFNFVPEVSLNASLILS